MQILYLSDGASKTAIEEARQLDPHFNSYAAQKFNRLVAEGLARNGHNVKMLSTFYLPRVGIGYSRHSEFENNVRYHYVITPNFSPARHVWIAFYCFFEVLFWGLFKKKDKALVANVLNISSCIGAVVAAHFVGLRCVGIMTDMPGMMVDSANSSSNNIISKRDKITAQINKSFLANFTHYVFLTEKMNDVVNIRHRPYMVMEGLVDADMQKSRAIEKDVARVLLYAGGLHERYGLKLLVEGFMQANVDGSELWIYGDGPFAEKLANYKKLDSRIVYKGLTPNNEVVESEMKATLLVNPRPSHEEFTQYSFPSKNMEYMVSGTPVLTTILPGMPVEYYSHVYLFDRGETVEGYAEVIRKVLNLSTDELKAKGEEARRWVLENKNNINQANRIIELINQ